MAATAAATNSASNISYCDGFRFNPFSSSPAPPPSAAPPQTEPSSSTPNAEPDDYKAGFDAAGLERAAAALRKINSSQYAQQVFGIMRNQEQTRQAELAAEKAHFEAIQTHRDIDNHRKWGEEQRNVYQQQAQAKAQMMRYEDELARKRMQTDHEAQRHHNVELVRMQEESSKRKEQARQATEEQIQAQKRQTEKERAEIEQETIRVKAMSEAEARAHEAKLTEDYNRRMLVEKISGEREKWLAAINTTFSHIEGGFRTLLNDRSKLVMAVGGVTALAAGVYTTREGARVTWGYINRILGQPSLIRESSMSKLPWSTNKYSSFSSLARKAESGGSKAPLKDIVLHPSLQKRIEHLARATANTKSHQAPFRNMMFYGPPGTGKTMVAREIARKSGLDYAMMTGGDVAPLGAEAVTKIHEIFDWSKKSKRGLLLFIDEADAFLCERNSTHMSEAQRSALNALLFRTGDQSRDVVLVLATNRPGDLDSAVTDRIDEVIEFPLPQEEERFKLLKLYLNKYFIGQNESEEPKFSFLFSKKPQKITIKDLSDDVFHEAAKKTEGFSGREIAKLMASVQAAVYGRPDCVLDAQLFAEIVDYKVKEHEQRAQLAGEGANHLNYAL